MPAPSPASGSAPTAPRWVRFFRISRPCSTMAWLFLPLMWATKPTPQASCSLAGSYRPCSQGQHRHAHCRSSLGASARTRRPCQFIEGSGLHARKSSPQRRNQAPEGRRAPAAEPAGATILRCKIFSLPSPGNDSNRGPADAIRREAQRPHRKPASRHREGRKGTQRSAKVGLSASRRAECGGPRIVSALPGSDSQEVGQRRRAA